MGKEAISPINQDEAVVAMRRLEYLYRSLPELAEWFEKNPGVKELWCFRLYSLDEGLRRLEAFLPEMRKAMQAHARGSPQGPDSSKARKPRSGEVISVREAKAKLEAHRAKVIAEKKKKGS